MRRDRLIFPLTSFDDSTHQARKATIHTIHTIILYMTVFRIKLQLLIKYHYIRCKIVRQILLALYSTVDTIANTTVARTRYIIAC